MSGVVAYSRYPLDECRHPGQRPQIRAKTVGVRALPERLVHQLQLPLVQFRFTTRPARTTDPAWLIVLPCLAPTADTLATHLEFPGNRCLGHLANGEQPCRASTPLLHGGKISSGSR